VIAVMHERAVVRHAGENLGSGEFFVHDRPQNTPISPNTPRENQSSGIYELAGAGQVGGCRQPVRAVSDRAGTMRMRGTSVPTSLPKSKSSAKTAAEQKDA